VEPYVAFFLATTIGLVLSLATYWVARHSGLGPVQSALIDTLQDNAAALAVRVTQLEQEVSHLSAQRQLLEQQIGRLRETVTDLAGENAELRRQLRMAPRGEP